MEKSRKWLAVELLTLFSAVDVMLMRAALGGRDAKF
jgi:hypothetical protein